MPTEQKLPQELMAYRSAFDKSMVGAGFMTLEGKLVWVNSAFASLIGYDVMELTGMYPRNLIHPDDLPSFRQRMADLQANTSTTITAERRTRHKMGHYIWLNITSSLVRDEKNNPKFAIIIGQDVTARKLAELELIEGKENFNHILENVNDVVWSYSVAQGKLNFLNEAATLSLYHREARDFLTNPQLWYEIVHPDDIGEVKEIINRLALGPTENYYRILRPSGEIRWVHSRSWSTRNDKGEPIRYEGINRDVTESKTAEIALRESEERLRLVMKKGHVGIFEEDLSTNATYWSDVVREICGVGPEFKPGIESFTKLIHPDDREAALQNYAELTQGRGESKSFRIVRPNGEIRWIEAFATLLRKPENNGDKLIGGLMDVTEARRAQEVIEAQRAKMTAAAKMSALGEMAGGLAHEINNPVAIIHGYAGVLKQLSQNSEHSDLSMRKVAEIIEQTCDRISKIVKSLRAFARDVEHDPFEKVTVKGIVYDTAEFCRTRFHSHGIGFRIDDLPESSKIECRPIQISQVLLNLLNNAHDAVTDQANPWIRISFAETKDVIKILVTDSGPGIPPGVRDKLFQPFFTTKDIGHGTGLGLSVSKGIVETHNGSLTLDTDNKNTCFVISLPKRQP